MLLSAAALSAMPLQCREDNLLVGDDCFILRRSAYGWHVPDVVSVSIGLARITVSKLLGLVVKPLAALLAIPLCILKEASQLSIAPALEGHNLQEGGFSPQSSETA